MFVGSPDFPENPDPLSILPCGATIYDTDLVITAAHCVKELSAFHLIFSNHPYDRNAVRRSVTAFEDPNGLHLYRRHRQNGTFGHRPPLFQRRAAGLGYEKATLWIGTPIFGIGTAVKAAGYGPCRDSSNCMLTSADAGISSMQYLPNDVGLGLLGGANVVKGDSGGPAYFENPNGQPLVFWSLPRIMGYKRN